MAKEHVVKEGAKVRKSTGDRIVDVIIYAALGLIALSTVLPFLYVVAGSFATEKELTEKAFFIIPTQVSLNAYQYAIRTANILRGLKNSIILTILGTVMCIPELRVSPVQDAFQGQKLDHEPGDRDHAVFRRHDPLLHGDQRLRAV